MQWLEGRGREKMQEEERSYFIDRVFLKFRIHIAHWVWSSNAMEKKDGAQQRPGRRAWANPRRYFSFLPAAAGRLPPPCPACAPYIIAAAAIWVSWLSHWLWLPHEGIDFLKCPASADCFRNKQQGRMVQEDVYPTTRDAEYSFWGTWTWVAGKFAHPDEAQYDTFIKVIKKQK